MLNRETRSADARSADGSRLIGAAALVLAGALAVGLGARRAPRGFSPPELASNDAGIVPWCDDMLEAIPGGGCFAAPPPQPETPLVVYLHGIYDRDAPGDELERQRRVARRTTAHGFALLALRAPQAACHPDIPEFATRFCWPSNEQTAAGAGRVVDEWRGALDEVERRIGPGKRFVLGFSSGGFFAGLLAVRGLFDARAFVVAGGGPVEPVRARAGTPPILLLSAEDDESKDYQLRFDDELTRERWPHDHYVRDGGHGLTDGDIETALTFFVRSQKEAVPLRPPILPPRPRVGDAGAEAEGAAPSDAGTEGGYEDAPDQPTLSVIDAGWLEEGF